MRCFYHAEAEAVGTCKCCGRGLCRDCAADLDRGLACKGRHEEEARRLMAYVERNVALSPTFLALGRQARRNAFVQALFFLAVGAVGIAAPFMSNRTLPPSFYVLVAIPLAFGFIFLTRALSLPAAPPEERR